MSKSRFELRVGIFVFIGLVLVAALLLQFSKGLTAFRGTYELRLKAANIGGLKKRSAVLMSGVQVGQVTDIKLSPTGTNVTIFAEIFDEYEIYSDARFRIEQAGFLGDNYVAVVPTRNTGDLLRPNEEVHIEEPFNLQEVARSAGGFIKRVDETAQRLNEAVDDVRRLLLNEETLTNLSTAAINMRHVSERALGTVDNVNILLATNAPSIAFAVSNVVFFSEQINEFAGSVSSVLATNSADLTDAMKNIEASTATLREMLNDVHAGKGLAGTVLKDESLALSVQEIARNLSVTTSNLNRLGLWGILWSRKPEKRNTETVEPLLSPRDRPN